MAADEDGGKEAEQESRAAEMAVGLAKKADSGEMIDQLREDALKEKIWGMRRRADWAGLLGLLRETPADRFAQEHGCWALRQLAGATNAQRAAMVVGGAIEQLVPAVERAAGRQSGVMQHGLHALGVLVACPPSQDR
eukprot:SAG22_NODE_3811_length_1521_cov_1.120956_2_plen_136_part_01